MELNPRGLDMTLEERSNLVLALARVLYANGQSTDRTLSAAERFGCSLGVLERIKVLLKEGIISRIIRNWAICMSSSSAPTALHMWNCVQ
jgi:uncharacterized membrane protein YjjP (DUF1212 family)